MIKNEFFNNKYEYLFIFFILISFFVGFYFQENSGGGKVDEVHIIHNFELIKFHNFSKIDWKDFESSSLPLFYFFYNLIIYDIQLEQVRLLNFFFSLLTYLIITCAFLNKYYNYQRSLVLLLSSFILISPYFRTSAFNALEENLAIFFAAISFLIYTFDNKKKKFIYFLFSLFFCFLHYRYIVEPII